VRRRGEAISYATNCINQYILRKMGTEYRSGVHHLYQMRRLARSLAEGCELIRLTSMSTQAGKAPPEACVVRNRNTLGNVSERRVVSGG
jgi:hypothetical protein